MQSEEYSRTCEWCNEPLTRGQKRFCTKSCWGTWCARNRPPQQLAPCRGCGERKKKHPAGASGSRRRELTGLCEGCYRKRLINTTYGQGHPYMSGSGYLMRHNPSHPEATGVQVYVHREVWYDANGPIPEGHHIHHINGDRTDNRLENLELISASEHAKRHLRERGTVTNQFGTWPVKNVA